MVVYGSRQNLVTTNFGGNINVVTFEIPKDVVLVGNSIDIIVRPVDGVCWKVSYDFTTDKNANKNLASMSKVGTDTNTMKWKVTNNVISFQYQNESGTNAENDSVISVVYHRNF